MYYRLEVFGRDRRWHGYYNGLRLWSDPIDPRDTKIFKEDRLDVSCSLQAPPFEMIGQEVGGSYLFWATPVGWAIMQKDVEYAKLVAETYGIKWRIVEREHPGKILWRSDEQAMIRIP